MIKILFLFVLLTSATVHAEPWTTEERAWGAVAGTLLLADWATTRYGSRHWNEGYHETNPLMGRHPHQDRVDLHFLIAIPAIYLFADYIPAYRREFLMVVTAVELGYVANNLRIGWQIKF
jgi:hypothetical protein